jgi:hypothetical protein
LTPITKKKQNNIGSIKNHLVSVSLSGIKPMMLQYIVTYVDGVQNVKGLTMPREIWILTILAFICMM